MATKCSCAKQILNKAISGLTLNKEIVIWQRVQDTQQSGPCPRQVQDHLSCPLDCTTGGVWAVGDSRRIALITAESGRPSTRVSYTLRHLHLLTHTLAQNLHDSTVGSEGC